MSSEINQEIQTTLKKLKDDVLWVSLIWNRFNQLYADNDERVRLLHDTAGGFLGMVQRMMVDATIMALARLVDPLENRYQENLSLPRLIDLVQKDKNSDLHIELNTMFDDLDELMKPLKLHRSKRIAHKDLALALEKYTFPPAIKGDIDKAISLVHRILISGEEEYLEGTGTPYDQIFFPGDVRNLVNFLDLG